MPDYRNKPLTQEEKKKLYVLLGEAQARGIALPPIPDEVFGGINRKWPIDSNGFFISNEGKLYVPTESQEGFVTSKARYSAFIGARGSGKTAAGAQKAMGKIRLGQSGAVLNPDFENFKISTWPEFKNWIPWDMVHPAHRYRANIEYEPQKPFTLVFLNGAKVICKGLKDADSAQGPNINWLWFDEAGRDKDGKSWQIANGSVRIGDFVQSWVTTTPRGISHWLYKFFKKQEFDPIIKELFDELGTDQPFMDVFHGTIDDNRDNLNSAFYASMLAAYPTGHLRRQELFGEFAEAGGKVGDAEWFKDKIIDELPEDWWNYDKVRYWDMAATEKKLKNDPDEAVGSLLGKNKDTELKAIIADQVGGYWLWSDLLDVIIRTAQNDGPLIPIVIEQEAASGGKNQVAAVQEEFKRRGMLEWKVEGRRPTDRAVEANTWFGPASQGKVYLLRGTWNEKLLEQVDGFLQIKHDDRVTSVSGGYNWLSPFKTWKQVDFIAL